MANMYRIYTQGDDYVGWHTAIYYHEELAKKYFMNVRSKHPDVYVVTEVVDEDTGKVLSSKTFGEPHGVTVEEVKLCRQECVTVVRYDIPWKETSVVAENVLPEVANEIILSGVGQDGFGTEWIYTIQPGCFCIHINTDNIVNPDVFEE